MSIDLDALILASFIDTDKVVDVVAGQFTYTYTAADAGGLYEIANPQPGQILLPFSIFSIDNGISWIGDLDGDLSLGYPDILTCFTQNVIRYRWGQSGPPGSFTVLFKTALLAPEV